MRVPEKPANEKERLKSLYEHSLLDTFFEEEYDQITKLASNICGTPISLISLIDKDRQWFKSNIGLDIPETPRDFAFCAHAINSPNETFIIPDSREDVRFQDNPFVLNDPNIVFYAGVPLVTKENHALGTLCVIDNEPKTLSSEKKEALETLANQVVKLFELRKKTKDLERVVKDLNIRNQALEEFARVAAHDIKSPINNIISLSDYIKEEESSLSDEGKELVSMIGTSAKDLSKLIDGILKLSRSSKLLAEDMQWLELEDFVERVLNMLGVKSKMKVSLDIQSSRIFSNHTALEQILINLIANSLKYNTSPNPILKIAIREAEKSFQFTISDNGPGISDKDQSRIFTIFQTTSNKATDGSFGSGIGLATVKALVEGLGGSIRVESEVNNGSAFIFTLDKLKNY